jgi:hypothetical protein
LSVEPIHINFANNNGYKTGTISKAGINFEKAHQKLYFLIQIHFL